jgi:RNA polymerase sigma factor (sigma-70 family)
VDEIHDLLKKLHRLLKGRSRSADDTDDLIQEAFLRLHIYCQDHCVRKPEAFLVRTVLNLWADRKRQQKREAVEPGALDTQVFIDPSPTPDEVYASQKRLLHWRAGLEALTARQREIFLLNRVEGLSFRQIGEKLGISLSTVEQHAAKAVMHLMDWMDQEGK